MVKLKALRLHWNLQEETSLSCSFSFSSTFPLFRFALFPLFLSLSFTLLLYMPTAWHSVSFFPVSGTSFFVGVSEPSSRAKSTKEFSGKSKKESGHCLVSLDTFATWATLRRFWSQVSTSVTGSQGPFTLTGMDRRSPHALFLFQL